MSKNKIPSSEVPGARPLPAAGTSPFPCSWRCQAPLTQSWSGAAKPPALRLCCLAAERAPVRLQPGLQTGKGNGRQTRKPSHQPLAVPAEPPPLDPARAERGALGAPTSARFARAEVRRPAVSPTASRRKRAEAASPTDPALRCASGSGEVPCDVAARRGRLRAGAGQPGSRAAGPGGAGPGRGAVSQLDGRDSSERYRCRTVSYHPTSRARARAGTRSIPASRPGLSWSDVGLSPRAQALNFCGFSLLSPHSSLPISSCCAPSCSSLPLSVELQSSLTLDSLLLCPFSLSDFPYPLHLSQTSGPLTSM